jgi:anion-transporting  ArsA/GET3 family ATPase
VAPLDAEVIQERQVVRGVAVPAVTRLDLRVGLAGIALVHRDDAKIRCKLHDWVPRCPGPKCDARSHATGRKQEQRKAAPVLLVIEGDARAFEEWHERMLPRGKVTPQSRGKASSLLAVALSESDRVFGPPEFGMPAPPSLSHLIESRRVILCVGCGGVGKTTVAAALGLAAARRGKRVLTLTIDPAKRLANSLGLERMTTEAQEVDARVLAAAGVPISGSLTVMMLDTKRTFDDLVHRFASSPEARDRILHNRLYKYVSTNLAGTQDYMAMEKLLAVRDDPRYDLVILDTPPTRNALDFLEAPERLVEALDGPAIRWFIDAFDKSRKLSLNLVAQGVAVVLRGVGKLTGGGFLEQMAELITDLNDLFGGFRERARRVGASFRSPEVAYVLITSPAPLAISEIAYFAERLSQHGAQSDAFVVNRVHEAPPCRPTELEILKSVQRHGLSLGTDAESRILAAVEDEIALAIRDGKHLAELEAVRARLSVTGSPLVRVRALPSDVHDVGTLGGIAHVLCPEV